MSWRDPEGPAGATMQDMIEHELHLIVLCYRCSRKVRMAPQEASDLLGSDCTTVMARDRLVCSWCSSRGNRWINAYPDTEDMSAQQLLHRAERELSLYEGPHYESALAEAKAEWDRRRPKDALKDMCNAYRLKVPLWILERDLAEFGLPLRFDGGARPNLPEWEMTRPTNVLPVFKPVVAQDPSEGLTLVNKRWWLVPFFHRGPVKEWKAMCTNARAETVATSRTFRGAFERRRCLVPADAYYEWTGEKGDKSRWRFERPDGDWFAFAGIWDKAETADGLVESYSIITTAAGPDAAPYHTRQPAILAKPDFSRWLDLGADVTSLISPSSEGTLKVYAAPSAAA